MKVEIIEEKRNGRLLVKVDNVKYNLPKGLVAKLTNDSLPVDVRVMPKIAELKEMLTDVIKSWESLDGNKNYKPKEIENWLINQMKPTIDKARTLLSNFTA